MNDPEISDFTEDDDFFRRGEQFSATALSLEPPMGTDIDALTADDNRFAGATFRTPQQLARRQRFIRYVSVTMGVLSLGSVLVFARQAVRRRSGMVSEGVIVAASPGETVLSPSAIPVEPTVSVVDPTDGVGRSTAEAPKPVSTSEAPRMQQINAEVLVPKEFEPRSRAVPQTRSTKKAVVRSLRAVVANAPKNVSTAVIEQDKPADNKPPTASFAD